MREEERARGWRFSTVAVGRELVTEIGVEDGFAVEFTVGPAEGPRTLQVVGGFGLGTARGDHSVLSTAPKISG